MDTAVGGEGRKMCCQGTQIQSLNLQNVCNLNGLNGIDWVGSWPLVLLNLEHGLRWVSIVLKFSKLHLYSKRAMLTLSANWGRRWAQMWGIEWAWDAYANWWKTLAGRAQDSLGPRQAQVVEILYICHSTAVLLAPTQLGRDLSSMTTSLSLSLPSSCPVSGTHFRVLLTIYWQQDKRKQLTDMIKWIILSIHIHFVISFPLLSFRSVYFFHSFKQCKIYVFARKKHREQVR